MTIDEANRLTVLGRLILKSVNRTEAYLELQKNERCVNGGRVLKAEPFGELVDAYREAEEKNMTKYVLLKALPEKGDAESIESSVCEVVPSADYIGYGKDGDLYILLGGTVREECGELIGRLAEKGIRTDISRENGL